MKRKNLRDIIISCFLISTLGTATFIVSCSDNSNFISTSINRSDYRQHIHGERGLISSAVTATFSSIGSGAAYGIGETLGDVGMGWALSSMGLVGSSGPDWEKEFNTINNDLTQIISLLDEADAELASIDSVLLVLNCSQQQTSLQNDIGAILNEYDEYNALLLSASEGDTALYNVTLTFANNVINGKTGGQVPIATALANIQANILSTNNVIVTCMQPIPKPANGTFRGDSIYYVSAQNLLNYYYYFQTMGIGLLSEAYHWKGWVAAGGPGSGQGYSADSIQLICNDQNALPLCNNVVVQTNGLYNSLLIQFKDVGAPYTGEDLLFQKNTNGDFLVWVRSLEDYTQQSGANCDYPLNLNNLCGPTAGKFASTLSYTTYYGTQNFIYPSLFQLNSLVNPTPTTTGTVGYFLDSLGFENMNVTPPKVLIADTLVFLTNYGNEFQWYIDTMTVIPYISPGYPTFKTTTHQGVTSTRAIYSEFYDFVTISMLYTGYELQSAYFCDPYWYPYQSFWTTSHSPSPTPWAGSTTGNSGSILFCVNSGNYDIYNIFPFAWETAPGWSYYSTGSFPQDAYFIPVRTNFSGTAGCLTGYNNLNSGGFITKCGEDFQDYLNLNLPRPPTCSIPNVNPPCTLLP